MAKKARKKRPEDVKPKDYWIRNLTPEQKKLLKKFGEVVRKERESQGLSLYDIEERGYPAKAHFQKIEEGLKNLNFTSIIAVCKALKIHPRDIWDKLPEGPFK